jgi:glyoxylase-like metal-dependent hydrolase (beta-lactamase superfamily II)
MGDRSFRLGGLELVSLDAGEFLYDGGAMFGAVPKVIWETLVPVDEQNRITLTLSPLLISSDSRKILVDAGFGARHTKRDLKVFGFDPERNVELALARIGLSPGDIDTVVLTHLHADHAGGATRDGKRGVEPAFPNARYIVNELEWQDALSPDPRSVVAYRRDDFVPLEAAEQLELVGDVYDLGDGVSFVRTGGHTRGHAMVIVRTAEGTAVYPADLIPSRHHARVPYVAGIDLFPLDMIDQKEKLLAEAVEDGWIVVLDHDPAGNVGRVIRDDRGRFAFRDIDG